MLRERLKSFSISLGIIFALTTITACSSNQPVSTSNSSLTQGNVQMNVVVGKTTKSDVLEVFGAPNVTTRNGEGNEIWTYQRQAQIQESSQNNSFGTLLIFGGGSSTAGFKNSSRMITLIIKFDSNDVVIDYSSRESNF